MNKSIKRNYQKIKQAFFLIRKKGVRYTYNYLWFHSLYRDDSLLRKIFLKWLFPYTVPYPPFIEVELTTKCNLKCTICEHTYWKEPGINMTFEQFKSIFDQFPHLKWIGLTGIGESFLNPDFIKILKYVKSKNVFVELYDNFCFLTEERAKLFIELGIDMLILSMDAATKETYEKIRVGANFDTVINNIKNFITLKEKMKSHFPQLDVHFIATKGNVHEIPQYVDLAHKIGITGNIRFTSLLHGFKEIANCVTDIPEYLIIEAEKKAKQYHLNLGWNKNVPPMSERRPINDCTVWIMPFIFVTGHVIPCCVGNEANQREFQKRHSLGNVFEKPFKEIWNSKEYKKFRYDIIHGKTPIQCTTCTAYTISRK